MLAVAVLVCSLQGCALSLAGQRRQVDPHWKRGLSFARIGLHWLQHSMITTGRAVAWRALPLQALDSCIPSHGVSRLKKQPWCSQVLLPPPLESTTSMAVA